MPGREFPSRQPAARVGGQRRRLSRPPPSRIVVPRSRTLPVLSFGAEPGGADAEPESNEGFTTTRGEEGVNTLETSRSMANFYPPTGGIPADLRVRDSSPTPTSRSGASSAATDGKKKHGLTLNNPFRKQAPLVAAPLPQTQLPPATPTKAAKFFGYNPESPHVDQADGGALDGVDVERPCFNYSRPRQHSVPVLTAPGSKSPGKIFENIETDDEDEPPKSKGFWGNSKKTAKKMWESPSRLVTRQQPNNTNRPSLPAFLSTNPEDLQTDYVNRIGLVESDRPMQYAPESHTRSDSDDPAHRRRPHPKTVNKHLAQKELIDRMTPITEASHDNMSAVYRDGEDNSELDVIDEYTDNYQPYTSLAIPERVELLKLPAPYALFELGPDDISPIDSGSERGVRLAEKWEEYDVHPGTPVGIKKQEPMAVRRRSPLQVVENRFLDVAEKELEAQTNAKINEGESPEQDAYSIHGTPAELSKAKQFPTIDHSHLTPFEVEIRKALEACDAYDSDRKVIDTKVARMKADHEKFKKDFEPYLARAEGREVVEDDETVSIRSSINLGEEPTLHVATAMTFMRITPGMVKLVDIPPRKNKNKNMEKDEHKGETENKKKD